MAEFDASRITATTADQELLGVNYRRQGCIIQSVSTNTVSVWLRFKVAVTGVAGSEVANVELLPGATWDGGMLNGPVNSVSIHAKTTTGTADILVSYWG